MTHLQQLTPQEVIIKVVLFGFAALVLMIAWAAIWLFSPRNEDEGELEELTGHVDIRKNNIENKQYPPDYDKQVMKAFNE